MKLKSSTLCLTLLQENELIRILNLNLRLMNAGVRFILLTYLTSALAQEEFILFGVLNALLALLVVLMGGEKHNNFLRFTIQNDIVARQYLSQFASRVKIYFLMGPICLLGFTYYWDINLHHLPYIFLIVVFEYFNQEAQRILIAENKQFKGTLNIFIRNSAWGIPLLFLSPIRLELITVLQIWLIANIACLAVSVIWLEKPQKDTEIKTIPWDKKLETKFIIQAASQRSILFLDKFLIAIIDPDWAAAYIYFSSIASMVPIVATSLLFQFFQRNLVKLEGDDQTLLAAREKQKALYICIFIIIGCILTGEFLIFYVLPKIVEPYIFKNSLYLRVLLWIQSVNIIMRYYHIRNYSAKADELNFVSHVLSYLIFLAVLIISFLNGSANGVILSVALFFISSLILKSNKLITVAEKKGGA